MTKTQAKLSRRNFLLAATAGTAATAAAIVGKKQNEKTTADDPAKPGSKGYQASEHVQNYYRTARI